MTTDARALLDLLADCQAQREVIAMDKQALIDSVLTPEIKAKLSEIEAEFADKVEAVDVRIAELTEQVKAAVLANGATVKGQYLQAVWTRGRVSWDTKALEGYAAAHPEILNFRTLGEPTVSLRQVKG